MTDSLPGLTVREASERLGVHVQTLRGRLRDGEDEGKPLGLKLTGDFGPEWRICPLIVALMKSESDGEEAQATTPDSPESEALSEIRTLIRGLREVQKALPDPTAQDDRITRGLTSNAEIIRDLAAQVGRLEAERDRLKEQLEDTRADRDRLRDELDAERDKGPWKKLIERYRPSTEDS